MQIAWLKKERVAALEKESAASIRADELEAALVQVADKRHLDETKRSLQAQVRKTIFGRKFWPAICAIDFPETCHVSALVEH